MIRPTHRPIRRPSRSLSLQLPISALALLAGCASVSNDTRLESVRALTAPHLQQELRWIRSDADRAAAADIVKRHLAEPLTPDSAVAVALANNPRVQAAFERLGLAEAQRAALSNLPNPGFSFGRARRGDELEIERGLSFDLGRLLTLPLTREIETRRVAAAERIAALDVLSLAARTRAAYYTAVAAQESLRYAEQIESAAQASAELARRMAAAGNWSALQAAQEASFASEAGMAIARARQASVIANEELARLLGLVEGAAAYRLPERLPALPDAPEALAQVEQHALDRRLDLQLEKAQTEALARNLGLSRVTRFINVLELGLVRKSESGLPTQRGYEVRFELPLFDWGTARVAEAEALYLQATHQVAAAAIDARSEVRAAHQNYLNSYEVARRYRDEVLPLRKRIGEENLLRYNGMLIGVFELLADARAQIESANGYIEALRDFWLAQNALQSAMVGAPRALAE